MAQQHCWLLVTSQEMDFGGGEMYVHYCGMDRDAASRVADAVKRRYENTIRFVEIHPLGTDDRGGGRHHPSDFVSVQGFNLDQGLDEADVMCEQDQ
jgi:hypothetical protein